MKYYFIILIITFSISCSQKKQDNNLSTQESEITLTNFSYNEIAKYIISTLMHQSPEIMTVKQENDLYIVSYIRKSDKQNFTYKIKFESDTAIWANIDGRWRNGPYDEKIKFQESNNVLKIEITYSDGSKSTEIFKK